MFEQTFKNLDDVLWKEAGCSSELDYTEQTSWLLFLKYLDDLEREKAQKSELVGQSYHFILDEAHQWSSWAAPKNEDGEIDHNVALTGDDLVDFVNDDLFPYLKGFKQRATSPDTIEYKIGEIFGEIRNKFSSGYSLRDALDLVDGLRFRSQQEKHELSDIYESRIKKTFLSNSDNASVALRKELLENCNPHTVLDCPGGTFQGAGVKTVVLFFEKGAPTRKVWYYQLDPGRNLGKTNPLNDSDLAEFIEKQTTFADSEKSWSVEVSEIDPTTWDLSVKNPNVEEEAPRRSSPRSGSWMRTVRGF